MYADHVELVSPAALMLQQIAPLTVATEVDTAALLLSLDDSTVATLAGDGTLPDGWREILGLLIAMPDEGWDSLGEVTGEDLSEIRGFRQETLTGLRDATSDMRHTGNELLRESGYQELQVAVNAGLLTLKAPPKYVLEHDEMLDYYLTRLKRLLSPKNKSTHVILDDFTATIARALQDEGKIAVSTLGEARMRRALTGAGILDRLPAFPDTPMDELLTLRNDLGGSLSRYRREVDQFSRNLSLGPLDEDAQSEVTDLYTHQVVPALDELRDQLAEHSIVREAAKRMLSDVKTLVFAAVTPAVALGISQPEPLSLMGGALLAGGALTAEGARHAIAAAVAGRDAKRAIVQSAGLFYLLEIDARTRHSS